LELERFGTRTGFWNGLSSDSKVSLYFLQKKKFGSVELVRATRLAHWT